ncbi:hypothetical protein N7532_000102 [Penicillium argentinense]|uniref:N-acetylgalactosaminide beta-1,3-galactosyltransferase n=1 Tax=Penicillium argentinense TaxID=1131581 RepID=A0A9W9G648_9EURO|nr:uncharacterized protein N7532_000102 [Penicillium argentinense]KAJ5112057.1 hypothetical protein N7532_000102 [Penicillium argentinense]
MFNSPRRWVLIVSPLLTLALVFYLLNPTTPAAVDNAAYTHSDEGQIVLEGHQKPPSGGSGPKLPKPNKKLQEEDKCGHIRRDMDDVFVVLKTGATEAQQKVPTQLRTTLQCVPNYAVFSDLEETIAGVQTYDVLNNVTEETMMNEPEFAIYHRLQQVGREGLTDEEWGDHENGPFGKTNNPGWKLDKWKFLPMIDGALEAMPDAKWYVFVEADTYVVWPNLINWLAHLDHTRSYYIGSPMQIGDILFAYGGSGVILSAQAMKRLQGYRREHQAELEKMTAEEWAGDCVLARALDNIRIPLTWAWPMMLTTRPWEIDHFSEGYGRQPWCYPAVSYHRMSPRDIEEMWQFDRDWFRSGKNALLLHADVYREFIYDGDLTGREDWDNMSSMDIIFDEPTIPSLDSCADACTQNPECLQYTWHEREGNCKHASTTFHGLASNGTYSGWIKPRVQKLLRNFQSSCPQVEYIFD